MADDSPWETLVHALIGAVVTVVVSFVPFSPIVGGAVAGYLEGDGGIRVGAISGLIAVAGLAVPAFLVVTFIGLFAVEAATVLVFVIVVVLAFLALYSVALSALGGYLGEYLAAEYDGGTRADRVR